MHDAIQFLIGLVLGFAAWRNLRRSSITLENPATRRQALAILGNFALSAGLALGIADLLSR